MPFALIVSCVALIGAQFTPALSRAEARSYSYAVTHSQYGRIGTYVRVIDEAGGVTHAQSRLQLAVKVLGLVVYRQSADQTEVWRGQRLMSFQTVTVTNGRQLNVSGDARDGRFLITSPSGSVTAPADVVASDPLSLNRVGPAVVVSIRSGKVEPVHVTGGESDTVMLNGSPAPARHYHVSTAAQANKWEVWLDPSGVPIKFRSLESGKAVDFTLVSASVQPGDAANPMAPLRPQP